MEDEYEKLLSIQWQIFFPQWKILNDFEDGSKLPIYSTYYLFIELDYSPSYMHSPLDLSSHMSGLIIKYNLKKNCKCGVLKKEQLSIIHSWVRNQPLPGRNCMFIMV